MVSVVTGQRYSAGGPRIAGLLSLAAEQALVAINGEVASRHPALRLIRLSEFGVELERQMVAASAWLHLAWHEQIGAGRFSTLWSALQEVTGRSDPQPTVADLHRRVIPGPPRGSR